MNTSSLNWMDGCLAKELCHPGLGLPQKGKGLSISRTEIKLVLSHTGQEGSLRVIHEEIKPKLLLLGPKAAGSSKGPVFES